MILKGVPDHTFGRSLGTASKSPTVVVPVRTSIWAPCDQDSANSVSSHWPLAAVINLIQSVNDFWGGTSPARLV
jgi:hypothetical protein